jgi:hypothetical protein
MSNSTLTLQSTVNLCATHGDLIPLAGVGGFSQEPALSLCNDVMTDLMSTANDWKVNRYELPTLVTCPNKQDYQFAGASAFTLGSTAQGWAIALATLPAISETSHTVTVQTLENHRFAVGDVVFITGATVAAYNSTFTDTGTASAWTGGWTITGIGATSFTFTHATSGLANSGAPGIFNFGWATSASMVMMNDTGSPQYVNPNLKTYRDLSVTSQVGTPEKVSVLTDNGNGVLKIRLYAIPGSTPWGVNIVYQASPPLKVSLSDTWAPFPDSMASMYRQGLIARMYRYINSPRADVEYQKYQAEIQKMQSSDDAESSSIYVVPEEPLLGYVGTWGNW